MDARASALAGHLAALGVGPGVVVGVMLERSFCLVIGVLAVLKAGGVYLPCDPSYPEDRLQIYLEDGKAVVVLSQAADVSRAQSMTDAHVVELSSSGAPVEPCQSASLKRAGAEDPAYVLFTSGSTGRPKGCVLPHRGLRELVWASAEFYDVREGDVCVMTTTICFDPSLQQLLVPLAVGGSVVLASSDWYSDPSYLPNLMQDCSVSHLDSTPAQLYVPLESNFLGQCTSLRVVTVGGDALPRGLLELFYSKASLYYTTYHLFDLL